MILIDASVLVGYIRRPSPEIRKILAEEHVTVCGVTRAEVLCGARTLREVEKLNKSLRAFQSLDTPESVWPELGKNMASLRSRGVVVLFQDALVATIAIHHKAELWQRDAHFPMIQGVIPALRLFVGPNGHA